MTNKIVIGKLSAYAALQYKQQLTQDGLINNQDYTWRYQPVKYSDNWSTVPMDEGQASFEFCDPSTASFYRLKWTK